MKELISRDWTIDEIFTRFPHKSQKLAQEMTDSGLACVGCSASTWETIEAGLASHGIPDEEIDALVGRLNAILEEKEDLTTISLTPKAAQKFLEILAEEGKQGWGLRFAEKAAGCSGFQYMLDYSEKAQPGDQIFASQGVEIHVKATSVPRLLGCTIDYAEGLNGAGFKITNPNVKTSCGCGSSHSY